jgi:hypothetical protein
MQTDPHQEHDVIILSSAVLQHFTLSPTALRAYIYLCSLPSNEPITASIPAIAGAIGKSKRTTVQALQALTNCGLISRDYGNGSQANQYHVTFGGSSGAVSSVPPQADGMKSPSPRTSGQDAAVAATPREAEQMSKVASNPPSAIRPAQPATVAELVTLLYRQVSPSELDRLKSLFPNEETLMARLIAHREGQGGAEGDMDIDFLAGVLKFDLTKK